MREKHVFEYVKSDWTACCEACGVIPQDKKIYIDEYKGFNPAYWCEDCVTTKTHLNFVVLGTITRNEYIEQQRQFVYKKWPM